MTWESRFNRQNRREPDRDMNTIDDRICINRWPKGRWTVPSQPSFSPEHDLAGGKATSDSVSARVLPAGAIRAPSGSFLDFTHSKTKRTKTNETDET